MATVRDRWVAPVRPNGLHGAPEGLWLMAQSGDGVTDTNVYLLRYEDGSVIRKVHTGLHRAGGLTIGGGAIWVTSERELTKLDLEGNILKTMKTNYLQGGIFFVSQGVALKVKGLITRLVSVMVGC